MTIDQELRKLALELAIHARVIAATRAEVLAAAQDYYDFLLNKETAK